MSSINRFYLALAINLSGQKELLGLWIAENEGSKFWLTVLTELNQGGVKDIFIACVDGLTGFPEAINAIYPKTKVQLCIVHLVRNFLRYVPHKDMKAVACDLKTIYRAITIEHAEHALLEFSEKWDKRYPAISRTWNKHWQNIITLFAFSEEIRKIIYTTNAIESLKAIKCARLQSVLQILVAIKHYRQHLNLSPLPSPDDSSPLIEKARGKGPIESTRAIRQIVQICFDKAIEQLRGLKQVEEAEMLRSATVHWLIGIQVSPMMSGTDHVNMCAMMPAIVRAPLRTNILMWSCKHGQNRLRKRH